MNRAERERLRFERRVRDSHMRWQIMGDLALGNVYYKADGLQVLRCLQWDLYEARILGTRSGQRWVTRHFIHPSWLK